MKQLESSRALLLRNTENNKPKDIIDNLYKPNAKVGNGRTMDAVRYEKEIGVFLSPAGHTQKLLDRRSQLLKLQKNGGLSSNDRKIVKDLLIDIQDALR